MEMQQYGEAISHGLRHLDSIQWMDHETSARESHRARVVSEQLPT
jgi:hypothetical protein